MTVDFSQELGTPVKPGKKIESGTIPGKCSDCGENRQVVQRPFTGIVNRICSQCLGIKNIFGSK